MLWSNEWHLPVRSQIVGCVTTLWKQPLNLRGSGYSSVLDLRCY
jgi:hypothetical protein